MIRPVRAELRRSSAKTTALMLFAVAVVFTAGMFRFWWQQWLNFGYVEASMMFFVAPLALAGGAMLGRREKRTRAAELMASTGRPRWQRASPAMAALGIAVAAAHLLLVGVCATLIGTTGSYLGAPGFATAGIDTALLVGAAWTGFAVARQWSFALLPPVLAAAALAVQFFVQAVTEPNPLVNLSLMVQFPHFPWEGPTAAAQLGRLAFAAGLLLGAALLAAAGSWRLRGAATAALAAGVAGLLFIPAPTDTQRYQIEPSAQRLVCADGTPQVCVTAVHAYALPTVAPDVRRALAALAKLPNAPTRAAEFQPPAVGDGSNFQFWGTTPTAEPGTVRFSLQLDWQRTTDPDLVAGIVYGAGTRWNGCEPGDNVANSAAGAWLLGADELHLREGDGMDLADFLGDAVPDTVRKLRALPEQEALRRVTALRDAANRCETDLLPILAGQKAAP
jgi:hypothetical protein